VVVADLDADAAERTAEHLTGVASPVDGGPAV
jgi:hypothetical protein